MIETVLFVVFVLRLMASYAFHKVKFLDYLEGQVR